MSISVKYVSLKNMYLALKFNYQMNDIEIGQKAIIERLSVNYNYSVKHVSLKKKFEQLF